MLSVLIDSKDHWQEYIERVDKLDQIMEHESKYEDGGKCYAGSGH
jgi:hypothetical protein